VGTGSRRRRDPARRSAPSGYRGRRPRRCRLPARSTTGCSAPQKEGPEEQEADEYSGADACSQGRPIDAQNASRHAPLLLTTGPTRPCYAAKATTDWRSCLRCSCDRQAGVPQERVGQVRSAAHALDAPVRLVDHLGQACRGQVGQLDGLEPGPQALDRVYRSGSTLTRFRCQSRSPTWFAASCTPGPT
jgi:hypothetical protein